MASVVSALVLIGFVGITGFSVGLPYLPAALLTTAGAVLAAAGAVLAAVGAGGGRGRRGHA